MANLQRLERMHRAAGVVAVFQLTAWPDEKGQTRVRWVGAIQGPPLKLPSGGGVECVPCVAASGEPTAEGLAGVVKEVVDAAAKALNAKRV